MYRVTIAGTSMPEDIRLIASSGESSRGCTHKRAGNVGFRGNSGRGLGIAECPLMTQSRHFNASSDTPGWLFGSPNIENIQYGAIWNFVS
jgi:hypothetical protein